MARSGPVLVPRRWTSRADLLRFALITLIATDGPLLADLLKAITGGMAGTTKQAKVASGGGEEAASVAIPGAYSDEAKAAAALFPGTTAPNQDLRTRFMKFAANADDGRSTAGDPARFEATFGALVGACRSCHSVYE